MQVAHVAGVEVAIAEHGLHEERWARVRPELAPEVSVEVTLERLARLGEGNERGFVSRLAQ